MCYCFLMLLLLLAFVALSPSALFFNAPATTGIYSLSLHDALPISAAGRPAPPSRAPASAARPRRRPSPASSGGCRRPRRDRKSTRLNSSHLVISYAVFCLKKKKTTRRQTQE